MKTCFPKNIRFALLALIGLSCCSFTPARAAEPTVAGVLALHGTEFARAAQSLVLGVRFAKGTPSQAELWQVMDKLQSESRTVSDRQNGIPYDFSFFYLADAILRKGDETDFKRLLKVYDDLPRDSYARCLLIDSMSEFLIKREIAALSHSKPTLLFDEAEAQMPLPPSLLDAAPALQSAWRSYAASQTNFDSKFPLRDQVKYNGADRVENQRIDIGNNWPLFYQTAGELFHGKNTQGENAGEKLEMSARLQKFEWAYWCGTGSASFYNAQLRLLFLALLRERRYDAAQGALGRLNSFERFSPFDDEAWKRDFIALRGQDWETLVIGAALDGQTTLGVLAKEGSVKSGRLLEAMHSLPMMTERGDYLRAVAGFITPARFAAAHETGGINDVYRAGAPIPDELQKQLLEILHAQVKPDAGLETINTLSEILESKARVESKAAFRRILEMPYGKARERAAAALNELGEKVEVGPARPVAFQLLVNGKAAPLTKVEWEMSAGVLGGVSSTLATDAEGILNLERDYLLDSKRPITALHFKSETMKSPRDTWFEITRALPANFEEATQLLVQTSTLSLAIAPNRALDFYPGRRIKIILNTERGFHDSLYYQAVSSKMDMPFAPRIEFAALQNGKYRVELFAPGAARWEGDITTDGTPARLPVSLQPGADVKFELVAPGGENRDRALEYVLLRDGKEIQHYVYYDYETQTYRGLPLGNYTLKIRSSAQKQNKSIAPIYPEYSGAQKVFVIAADSPPLLDLGAIILAEITPAARPSAVTKPRAG